MDSLQRLNNSTEDLINKSYTALLPIITDYKNILKEIQESEKNNPWEDDLDTQEWIDDTLQWTIEEIETSDIINNIINIILYNHCLVNNLDYKYGNIETREADKALFNTEKYIRECKEKYEGE